MAESTRQRGERLQIMLNPEELDAVDDFRFKRRMPSRPPGSCGSVELDAAHGEVGDLEQRRGRLWTF